MLLCITEAYGDDYEDYAASYQLNRIPSWNHEKLPAKSNDQEIKIAYWNIQVQWITDKPEHLHKYPQYAWKGRLKPIVELIEKESPDVLGFSECNLVQAKDLQKHLCKKKYRIFGYSSETLQSIDETEACIAKGENPYYGEFVGFLYNADRIEHIQSQRYALKKGKKHNRVLVVSHFFDTITKKEFVVLASHFDHLCPISREKSAEMELGIIEEFEKQKMPWFSLADRNWYPDADGEQSAKTYLKHYVVDFRDQTEQGHFGPSGTFAGHLGLESNSERPVIMLDNGLEMIKASSVDVHFRSKTLVKGVNSYSYTCEFDPETYRLLPETCSKNPAQRNFASDHYYTGGTFVFIENEYSQF